MMLKQSLVGCSCYKSLISCSLFVYLWLNTEHYRTLRLSVFTIFVNHAYLHFYTTRNFYKSTRKVDLRKKEARTAYWWASQTVLRWGKSLDSITEFWWSFVDMLSCSVVTPHFIPRDPEIIHWMLPRGGFLSQVNVPSRGIWISHDFIISKSVFHSRDIPTPPPPPPFTPPNSQFPS